MGQAGRQLELEVELVTVLIEVGVEVVGSLPEPLVNCLTI